jgi:hypothetical protein
MSTTATGYTSNIVTVSSGKYKLQWKQGDTVICEKQISVIGSTEAAQECLRMNLQELRRMNAGLFISEEEPEIEGGDE